MRSGGYDPPDDHQYCQSVEIERSSIREALHVVENCPCEALSDVDSGR